MRLIRVLAVFILCLVITFTMPACFNKSNTTPAITGLVYLGYGYNIFGEYAKPSSIKARVFNLGANDDTVSFNGANFSKPGSVELIPNNEANISSIFGEGYSSFLQKYDLSAEISRGFLCWQDTIKMDFQYSQSDTNSYYYHRLSQVFKKYTLRMPTAGSDQFKAMINAQFKTDLSTMEPTALFDKYGTHYLAEVVIGARCDYNARTVKNAQTTTMSGKIEVCGGNSFAGIGADVNVSGATEAEMATYNANTNISIRALGGRSEFADSIRSENDFDQWLNSIDTSNLSMSNFTSNSLKPIWDLCDDPARKAVLDAAFSTYAEGKQIIGMDGGDQCIMNLTVVANSSSTVNVPQGYTMLGTDLNQGCGEDTDFIYLCYKNGLDSSTNPYPITDLTMINGDGAAAPPGYTKINVDLNQDAGGDFIYLCYKRDPAKAANAIRKIAIKVGDGVQAGAGYSFVTWWGGNNPADVNKGADGSYIYIAYTTQLP